MTGGRSSGRWAPTKRASNRPGWRQRCLRGAACEGDLNSPWLAPARAGHESELEEAALLRLASDLGHSLLRGVSAAFRSAACHETRSRTVGDHREGGERRVSAGRGHARRRGVPRPFLPPFGVGRRVSRDPSAPALRAPLPNPSFKWVANGALPGPRGRAGYHRSRGQGATPLVATSFARVASQGAFATHRPP